MQFKCVPVRPGQHMFVTLKTIPNYCKAMWSQRHLVPGISIVFVYVSTQLNFLLILQSIYNQQSIYNVATHDVNNIIYCPLLFIDRMPS